MKCVYSIHLICKTFGLDFASQSYTCTCCLCGPETVWSSRLNWALVKLLVEKHFTRANVCVLDFTHMF